MQRRASDTGLEAIAINGANAPADFVEATEAAPGPLCCENIAPVQPGGVVVDINRIK